VRDSYLSAYAALDVPGYLICDHLRELSGGIAPYIYFNFFPSRTSGSAFAQDLIARSAAPESLHTLENLSDLPDNGYLDAASGYALEVCVFETVRGIQWSIRHDPNIFEDNTVSGLSRLFAHLLDHFSEYPDAAIRT
jgi:hypothetical protein